MSVISIESHIVTVAVYHIFHVKKYDGDLWPLKVMQGQIWRANRKPMGPTYKSPRGVQPRICHRFRDISSQNFDGWPFDLEWANPWAKGHQKRRWPTIHLDLPSYRISARARKRSARYKLLKFFTFWLRGQPVGQSSLNGEMICWTPSSTILLNFITLP